MATFTALQIVNRIHLRLGGMEFADLTTQRAKLLLNIANEAKDLILESRSWDFDSRSDGVLATQGQVTDSGATAVTNGAAGYSAGAFTAGNYVARILVTSDPDYSDVAYRIVGQTSATSGNLDSNWLGTTTATGDSAIVFYEYAIPDTVKDILSVRHQDRTISLTQIGREESFHSVIPRPTDEISDTPEIVVVGSQVSPTYASGGSETLMLGLLIYPCPLNAYRLDYSYTVRHPALSDSQGLANVPDYIIHEIVIEATALAFATNLGNEPQMAELNRRIGEVRQSRMFQANKADPRRRNVLRSLDAKSGLGMADRPADDDIFYSG